MRTRFLCLVVIMGVAMTVAPLASGQTQPNADRIAALSASLEQMNKTFSQLTPNHRVMASSLTHRLRAAGMFMRLSAAATAGKPLKASQFSRSQSGAGNPGVVSVNDNSTDLDFSSFDGVTQSTTSSAMCGNQVVVGFNDFGSFIQTFVNTFDPNTFNVGPLSQTGAAVSSDGGKTFHDIGTINPGSDTSNYMISDPVLNCSDANTFYYTQTFGHGGLFFFPDFTSISMSKSTDGGNTWGEPVLAADKDSFTHVLDKPSVAIDPSNPQRIYVTYTDFDFSFSSAGCGFQTRTAIEMVTSNDGGVTFPNTQNPIIIDEVCGDNSAVQASHVAFNSRGVAYVAWERLSVTNLNDLNNIFTIPSGSNEVRVTHVAPDGTVAPSVFVDQKVFGGDTFVVEHGGVFDGGIQLETDLQGQFRDIVGLDLAVDRSGGPNDGAVYVTWDDGRNKSVPDLAGFHVDWTNPPFFIKPLLDAFPNAQINLPFAPLLLTSGNYLYTDILVSKSKDGLHFGPSMQVNSDVQPKIGGGHDHFQPGIATDRTGLVAICWYDRRNDPRNFNIERFCAESKNGNDWSNFRVPVAPFAPIHRLDFELASLLIGDNNFGLTGQNVSLLTNLQNSIDMRYMGDYDGLTSDFTGKSAGFVGAFEWMSSGMNPDVKAYRF